VDAGKVELDGATYAGFNLPFSLTQLIWIEVILVGGAEIYRNGELNPEKRCYPGANFQPRLGMSRHPLYFLATRLWLLILWPTACIDRVPL
jgi:light-harvesting complex II chlorophyll a/b binding protein 4